MLKNLRKIMTTQADDYLTTEEKLITCGLHRVRVKVSSPAMPGLPRQSVSASSFAKKFVGHALFPCSHAMNGFLVSSGVCSNRRVLELGCGLGVCGIMAHLTGAAETVITDGDKDLIPRLQQAILTNVVDDQETKENEEGEGGGRPIRGELLRWGIVEDIDNLLSTAGKFDYVIGSDLLYMIGTDRLRALANLDSTAQALFLTAGLLLLEGGTFYLAHELRDPGVEDVVELIAKHSIAQGFGPPRIVKADNIRLESNLSADCLVLGVTYNGSARDEHKDNSAEMVLQGWIDIFHFLEDRGVGAKVLAMPPLVVTTKQLSVSVKDLCLQFLIGDEEDVDDGEEDDDRLDGGGGGGGISGKREVVKVKEKAKGKDKEMGNRKEKEKEKENEKGMKDGSKDIDLEKDGLQQPKLSRHSSGGGGGSGGTSSLWKSSHSSLLKRSLSFR